MTMVTDRLWLILNSDPRWAAARGWKVVLGWEVRRLPFNLLVGATGLLTCLLVFAAGYVMETYPDGEAWLPDAPMFGVMALVFYGVTANVCYTGGWMAELPARVGGRERAWHFGEVARVLGTGLSMLVTCVPAVVCWLAVVLQLLGKTE